MSLESYHIQNNEQLKVFIDGLTTPGRLELRELTIDLSLQFENTTYHLEREKLATYLQHLQNQMPLFPNLHAFTMYVGLPVPYPANQNYFDFDLFNKITNDLDGRKDWRGDTSNITMQGAIHGIYSFWSKGEYNASNPSYLTYDERRMRDREASRSQHSDYKEWASYLGTSS